MKKAKEQAKKKIINNKTKVINKVLEDKIAKFNPNENGLHDHGIFGLPFGTEESKLVLMPVPWEATVSCGGGTSNGPKEILDASQQIDLYDEINPLAWRQGIAMQDIPADIYYQSEQVKEKVEKYLGKYMNNEVDQFLQDDINKNSNELNDYVRKTTQHFLDHGKIVGIVGGDHSVPLGFLESLSEKYKNFGVLHIDAHADLREAYEGLKYSHASIFYNALKIKNISKLVQIGVRDFSNFENEIVKKEKGRVIMHTDYAIRSDLWKGKTWAKKCDEIVKQLPKDVYISFDIDGLMPHLSPNTGTPVLGGFSLDEIVFLLEKIVNSGRHIIGFDLCEVSIGDKNKWDGNVGARVLYKLCLLTLKSQK